MIEVVVGENHMGNVLRALAHRGELVDDGLSPLAAGDREIADVPETASRPYSGPPKLSGASPVSINTRPCSCSIRKVGTERSRMPLPSTMTSPAAMYR
ncbi:MULTISPECIES: hypothetical protein [Streptomyces]|uniref:Uncharacterized protein n=1 Tax=Streptomyces lonegramiae TaxID=3075524 RepID=A0ABU2X5Q4_9ACTN|nr:hypothetical protein [Streptomyces sp. DSM 41529]MDT0541238.1 hypothetical protein [Streptomyces sp. DSM 41529]